MSQREPLQFPPLWADAWGDDCFGLWAEFCVAEVVQRMRWIEHGQFLMGSSSKLDSGYRVDDEGPQHLVRLTAGFWLADSTCTQALWHAAIGSNPSHFKDDPNNPVERVSWDDVPRFFDKLNALSPELNELALPSEAQWEYACRAGTTTPFSFGDDITPEQVNYDGNFAYRGKVKGLYREKTVPVKSLPPNPWGLFEMHGNVWEWCCDGPRPYGEIEQGQAEVDPVGPQDTAVDALRALRGGSWIRHAQSVRSARRATDQRGGRNSDVGFRFVLRS